MRKSVIAVTAAAVMGFGGSALAGDPVVLTDGDMDQVVAGISKWQNTPGRGVVEIVTPSSEPSMNVVDVAVPAAGPNAGSLGYACMSIGGDTICE